ncbi:MAG: hypothetical protein ACFFCS_22525 [Candidatus Hodarchaeota archaeon]
MKSRVIKLHARQIIPLVIAIALSSLIFGTFMSFQENGKDSRFLENYESNNISLEDAPEVSYGPYTNEPENECKVYILWILSDTESTGGSYCITQDGTVVAVGTWLNNTPIEYVFNTENLSGDFEFVLTFYDSTMDAGVPSSIIVHVDGPNPVLDFFTNHFWYILIIVGISLLTIFYSRIQVKKIKGWRSQLESSSIVFTPSSDLTNRINRKRRALLSYFFPGEKIEANNAKDEDRNKEPKDDIKSHDDQASEPSKVKGAKLFSYLFCVECRKLIREKENEGHAEVMYCPICKKSLLHMVQCPYCFKKIAMKNYARSKGKIGQCPSCKRKIRII